MAMKNPYNYSMPNGALKFKTNFIKNSEVSNDIDNTHESSNKGKSQFDIYKEQKIMTAKPEELTLMLYEGILKFLKQAKIFIEQNNIEKANNVIIRAQNIISELNITLNMEYEISGHLRRLYTYMNDKLIYANVNKDIDSIDLVLGLAQELRDTWKSATGLANNIK